jgi:tRNA threonylcarbamoyl adenosine modification protein YeaZ
LWYNKAREVVTLYTLFIDTHDKKVLMILYRDGKIINKEYLETKNKHSEVAMPTIEKVLKDANVDVSDLGGIIVVNGPGSFTGERIAVTIAKTISYALSIPVRTIDALTILALGVDTDKKIVALEDRNGAFVGMFDSVYNTVEPLQYMNKSTYIEFKNNNEVNILVDVDYEKVYELSKLNRDVTNSIDDSGSVKSKKILRDLQEEIINYQKSGEKMSRYELEHL